MKLKTVLVTGIGAPGAPGIIKSLRLNRERELRIIGVDADLDNSVGVGLVDKSFKIPTASHPDFITRLLEICMAEAVDVLLPLVTNELFPLSKHKSMFKENGIKILVSDFDALRVANDKYELMRYCVKIGVPAPSFKLVKSLEEFQAAAKELGYPHRKICFKPPVSNGLRGFRIINDTTVKMDNLINEKPNNVYIGYDEFLEIAKSSSYFPELLVMEYLPGEEFSVDALGDGSKSLAVIPRTRDKIKMGISFVGSTIKQDAIIAYSSKIINELHLYGNIGFQFRVSDSGIPKIIESNPRVQGTIVLCTAAGYNMVYNAIKIALDETPIDYQIRWGTKMVRFWDEMFFHNDAKFSLG